MARTAPVPNMVAIPGMNPGIFVMGGGGDSGGSGAGDGSADGKGTKGKGCGKDNPGCGHASHGSSGAAVGDPVDVGSGAVFLPPSSDVHLAGAFPLVFQRSYRSARVFVDVGLGPGWSHSFAWRLTAGRRFLRVHRPDGTTVEVSRLDVDQTTLSPEGLILKATPFGYVISDQGQHIVLKPGIVPDVFLPTLFVDSFGNSVSLEYEEGKLVRVDAGNGRVLRVRWDPTGHLVAVQVKTASVQGRWQTMAHFDYDDRGALVRAEDVVGAVTRYEYDEDYRLTCRTTPNGFRFVYHYDDRGRATSSWCEADDPAALGLADAVPELLADGQSRARGIYHVLLTYSPEFVEVVTGRGVDRYTVAPDGTTPQVVNGGAVHTRDLDLGGRLLRYVDPAGAVTKVKRDGMGNVIEVVNPAGAITQMTRNEDGALACITDPLGGVTTIDYAPGKIRWRDPVGAMFEIATDPRGLITSTVAPNGGRTDHVYDVQGNETHTFGRYGQETHRTFDAWGRLTSITDGEGGTRRYVYNDRGDLLRVIDPMGGTTQYDIDHEGNPVSIIDADGRVARYRYGPMNKLIEVFRGDRRVVRLGYDRDGLLVEIRNGLDERYAIERDVRGLPICERTFDGRQLQHGYDEAGRLVWSKSGPEDLVEHEYDVCGRLVATVFADGHEDHYEYDAMGSLVRASSGDVVLEFERNAAGWPVRERQTYKGQTFTIEREFDGMGNVVRESSSGGDDAISGEGGPEADSNGPSPRRPAGLQLFKAEYERDEYGLLRTVLLDGARRIDLARDFLGRETLRVLPLGGRIETQHDVASRVVRRTTHRPIGTGRGPEPAWIGAPPDLTSSRAYGYSSASEIVHVVDGRLGEERFEYDIEGQLLSVVPEAARARLFSYDEAGNRFDREEGSANKLQRYSAGGRVVAHGDDRYHYDESGRLVAREGPHGSTKYTWGARGTLDEVTMPDGRVARYVYDAFFRRIAAEVVAPPERGKDVLRKTRFVWNAEALLHDIDLRFQVGDFKEIREERTYCADREGLAPFAQRLRTPEGIRWSYSVPDPRGSAPREVDDRGEVVAETNIDVWGAQAKPSSGISRFGLAGQTLDDTGLAYNRFRYYDPRTGQYLSPDPVGLAGGLRAYGFSRNNPLRFADVLGLMPTSVIYDADGNVIGQGVSAADLPAGTTVTHGQVTQGAITQASNFVDNNGNRATDASRSSGPCAEAAALSDLERRVRSDMPNASNDQVRAEMQRRMQGGRMETRDDQGRLMAPCPTCARMIDNMGMNPNMVVAPPGAAGPNGRWNGVSTQSNQGGALVNRPDNRAETANMNQPGYRTPNERAADERAATQARNRAVNTRAQQLDNENYQELRSAGFTSTEIRQSNRDQAGREYDTGQLNPDGTRRT